MSRAPEVLRRPRSWLASVVRSAAIEFAAEIAMSAPLAVVATRATMRGDIADFLRASTLEKLPAEYLPLAYIATTVLNPIGVDLGLEISRRFVHFNLPSI